MIGDDFLDQLAENPVGICGFDLAGTRRGVTASAVAEHQFSDIGDTAMIDFPVANTVFCFRRPQSL